MKEFNKTNLQYLKKEILNAVKTVSNDHDLKSTVLKVNYSGDEANIIINLTPKS